MLLMPFIVGQGCRRARFHELCKGKSGAEGENRTPDTAIFSRVLYRLSYLGPQIKCTHAIWGGSNSNSCVTVAYSYNVWVIAPPCRAVLRGGRLCLSSVTIRRS